ncbi:hypothetical protein [Nonomuraea sp. NPDC049400]|uniref:hypothetical protein n=1 Tax=Nonomuraea sp. NPDC049400 TaxID=3364352 RepID=UPI0037AF5EF0
MTERDGLPGVLEQAILADLAKWRISEDSSLAASALDLARRLDVPDVRPAAASMLHAQLRMTLAELVKMAAPVEPEQEKKDPVDELASRREDRRKGA